MSATHFLMKTLPRVSGEMALHVLAYNLTRVMNIMGSKPLLAAVMDTAASSTERHQTRLQPDAPEKRSPPSAYAAFYTTKTHTGLKTFVPGA